MAPDTTHVGSVDTAAGPLAIGTAANMIRLDASSDENELTIAETRALILRLTEAMNDAEDWTIAHPGTDDE